MTSITLKIAQRAVLAALFVSTAAVAQPAHTSSVVPQVASIATAPSNTATTVSQVTSGGRTQIVITAAAPTALRAPVACDVVEGTPDCHDGYMPRP
jgi:hypothetical protein